MSQIITAEKAYEYAKNHYPMFPSDWNISAHFTWNEVFINEKKEYGCPTLDVFRKAVKMSVQLEKIRIKLGKPMNIHCWVRTQGHNLLLKAQGYKPAMHSSHLYGMAVDYSVVGMTEGQVRTILLVMVKKGELQIRIEANTKGWVHSDIGNPYTNDYRYGVFNP